MHHKLKLKSFIAAALTLGAAMAFSVPARADETGEKGRPIFDKYQHAIVTVQVVQKLSASGRQGREIKQDLTGTVIDPSGLTVLALSSVDPAELSRRLGNENSFDIEVSDLKFLLEDGTEAPAEIVLRDKDLDLAFVRPKTKPATPMTAVDLTKTSRAQVLDQLITLNRLKRAAGRAFCASVERISAVVQKPRTFYIPAGDQTDTTLGSPAFALDGGIVGIVVMRAVNAQGAANTRDAVSIIILPAEDIAKAAAQAPAEAKPDAAKTAAPKADAPAKQ